MQQNSNFAKFFCNNQNIFWGTALVCVSRLGNYSSVLREVQESTEFLDPSDQEKEVLTLYEQSVKAVY